MVILCFGIAVSTRTYVAYAALSLVVEINSVFLHARQLLTIGGIPKSSWIYRTNAIMNVSTFVLFRILLLGWMTRWLSTYGDNYYLYKYTNIYDTLLFTNSRYSFSLPVFLRNLNLRHTSGHISDHKS